jgi:glycosyltransferase involved in cell wall biosynthesis
MDELVTTGVVDTHRSQLIRGSGVDPDFFKPADLRHGADAIRILFASRLLGEKGIRELVVAMAEVVKIHPNAVLWVAGEPYAQNPTSLTDRDLQVMGSKPWLKLFGQVDDMLPLLQQSDIVALPSYREGTPKILLEAASCGLPIVATDIAGCRGVVEEGVNGYLVPVKDSVELTGALLKLCGDAALRKAMGKKGRDIILQDFTSEIVIRKTLAVYQSLLSQ